MRLRTTRRKRDTKRYTKKKRTARACFAKANSPIIYVL